MRTALARLNDRKQRRHWAPSEPAHGGKSLPEVGFQKPRIFMEKLEGVDSLFLKKGFIYEPQLQHYSKPINLRLSMWFECEQADFGHRLDRTIVGEKIPDQSPDKFLKMEMNKISQSLRHPSPNMTPKYTLFPKVKILRFLSGLLTILSGLELPV